MKRRIKIEPKSWTKLEPNEIMVYKPIIVDWTEEITCTKKVNGRRKDWKVSADKLLDYLWLTEPK